MLDGEDNLQLGPRVTAIDEWDTRLSGATNKVQTAGPPAINLRVASARHPTKGSPPHQRLAHQPTSAQPISNFSQHQPEPRQSLPLNKTMTAETTNTRNEPIVPTSPPAKRIKTDAAASTASETMGSTSNGQQQELQPPPLLIKKLSDKARLPTRGSAFAAGYDLYAARDTIIPGRGKALVDTDISMSVPAGTCESTFSSLFLGCILLLGTDKY